MITDRKRLSVRFSEEDYQWLDEKAELTGSSRAAILRQIIRGLRLERPALLTFGNMRLVLANGPEHTDQDSNSQKRTEKQADDTDKSGVEAFRTD